MTKEKNIRATFSLSVSIMGDLQRLVAELKATARAAGKRLPTGSSVVETALRAEIKKRQARHKETG